MTESLDLPSLEERRSVRGQVAHALRAALVAGQMRPGEVYSAPTLAAQFGVSATPSGGDAGTRVSGSPSSPTRNSTTSPRYGS